MLSWFTIPAKMPTIQEERNIQEMMDYLVLLH